jgi:hypothetical protein
MLAKLNLWSTVYPYERTVVNERQDASVPADYQWPIIVSSWNEPYIAFDDHIITKRE